MREQDAHDFIIKNARPLDLAVYQYFFQNGNNANVVIELSKYQNEDGGFGNGLEPDYLNLNSSPIATNDAIITLHRVNALSRENEMVGNIVRYLKSQDSYDKEKKRWLFAIESNKDYPHAIWWEKNNSDGIHGFNPTISLAAFMFVFDGKENLYKDILREGIAYLEKNGNVGGDELKAFLLAYELLKENNIHEIVDLSYLKDLLSRRIYGAICKDIEKYGIEYVPVPSDFFAGNYLEFITEEMKPYINAEKEVLSRLQMPDGGFDISWEWYTDYAEFEQARNYWRPRITIDKLLFFQLN
ncbi:MAG: hypothetical protein ACI4EH_11655 [Oliverpabstia sp.]